MGQGSKKVYWVSGAASFILVFFFLAVILPRIVDSDWLKELIQTEFTQHVSGNIDFQKAELSILPVPVISLHNVNLDVPDTVEGSLDTVRLYPMILPLFLGSIELGQVIIDSPDLSLPLPGRQIKKQTAENYFLSVLNGTSAGQLSQKLSDIPYLKVRIHNGSMHFYSGPEQIFLFENINGSFVSGNKNVETSLNCSSNLWKSFELNATFAPDSQKGNGRILLREINGKTLTNYFLPEISPRMETTLPVLEVGFTYEPESGLKVDIQSEDSSVTAVSGGKTVTAKIDNLKGSIQLVDNRRSVTVEDLSLSYPGLRLGGSFLYNKAEQQAGLNIEVQNGDITGLQESLPIFINAFYGDLPIVEKVFDIIKGGTATRVSFNVAGKSLKDLAVFESMFFRGRLENTDVTISYLDLHMQEVTGEATISGGVLKGKNLEAKLGNTTGKDGSLLLGLVQKHATPFQLDLELDADFADVLPVLKRLLPDPNMQYHLSLFKNIEGAGQGRLTLGNNLDSFTYRIEVEKINLRGNYSPIPFPIIINGGKLAFNGQQTESYDIQGKLGESTFTGFSSKLNWTDEPVISVQSGTFHLVLDEIFPWLAGKNRFAEIFKDIKKITGVGEVVVKNIKGPLLQPAKMQYELHGSINNIVLTSDTLPGSLEVKTGRAEIFNDKIILEDLQAGLLGSSITLTSGVIQNLIEGSLGADLTISDSTVGHQVMSWITREVAAPYHERILTQPVIISQANLRWARNEFIDLQGDFSIRNGPSFTADLMMRPDHLVLRNFNLKSDTEQASIKLDLKKREIRGKFHGSISKRTVESFLLIKEISPGAWIKGDLDFQVNLDSPEASTASGKLEGGSIRFSWKYDRPLLLNNFSLSASDGKFTLNSAETVFDNGKYQVNGQASMVENRLDIEADVSTGTVDLENLLAVFLSDDKEIEEKEKDGNKKSAGKFMGLSLHGGIRFKADSLLYKGYNWEPVQTIISYDNNSLSMEILEAKLCRISTPGKISIHDGQITMDFNLMAKGEGASKILTCLAGGEKRMTGTLYLKADVSGQGTMDTLANSLHGKLRLEANDGYIYQDAQMAKLLYFLNVTNMFKEQIPNLQTTGFEYDHLAVRGVMEKGILEINPANIEAPIMNIASHGTIDIPGKKINLQVLVAPVQTVNKIRNKLPVIKQIIPHSIAAVPVKVSGDFFDFEVKALSLSALSNRVFDIMVDTLVSPVGFLEEVFEE